MLSTISFPFGLWFRFACISFRTIINALHQKHVQKRETKPSSYRSEQCALVRTLCNRVCVGVFSELLNIKKKKNMAKNTFHRSKLINRCNKKQLFGAKWQFNEPLRFVFHVFFFHSPEMLFYIKQNIIFPLNESDFLLFFVPCFFRVNSNRVHIACS